MKAKMKTNLLAALLLLIVMVVAAVSPTAVSADGTHDLPDELTWEDVEEHLKDIFYYRTDENGNVLGFYRTPIANTEIENVCQHDDEYLYCEIIKTNGPASTYCASVRYFCYTLCRSCDFLYKISVITNENQHEFDDDVCFICGWEQ